MLYTSYFAKIKSLPKDVMPISICAKAPSWYHGAQYKKLAPKYGFFSEWKKTHDNDYYTRCFQDQVLDHLNAQTVLRELTELAGTDQIALLCYEKPNDFCHRHLVANWLQEHGVLIKEYGI